MKMRRPSASHRVPWTPAALALAACAVALAAPGPGPAAPRALAPLHIGPGGSDSNPCTAQRPCRSFDRAYRVASPGQVVEVAGGTYPGQGVRVDAAKSSSSDVVFRPA